MVGFFNYRSDYRFGLISNLFFYGQGSSKTIGISDFYSVLSLILCSSTILSIIDKSFFVWLIISRMHFMQNIGWLVNPPLFVGILKHVSFITIAVEHLLQCVSFLHIWVEGLPLDWDKRDGILPFGFVI